jgi:hypothetical protein
MCRCQAKVEDGRGWRWWGRHGKGKEHSQASEEARDGLTVDVKEQRVRFVVTASRGEKSFRELCAEFAISRPTGCQWLKRYEVAGIAGVQEQTSKAASTSVRR